MDLNKLTTGDKIVAGSFLAFFIAMLLPWFGEGGFNGNGFDVGFFWGTFPLLLGIVMVVQIALDRFTTTELPELPVTWGQIHLGLGGFIAFLVIIKLLIGEEVCFLGECVSISRKFGLFLAVLAAIGMAVGGFFKMQEDGGTATAGTGSSSPPQSF
jgi:hypothetical protein